MFFFIHTLRLVLGLTKKLWVLVRFTNTLTFYKFLVLRDFYNFFSILIVKIYHCKLLNFRKLLIFDSFFKILTFFAYFMLEIGTLIRKLNNIGRIMFTNKRQGSLVITKFMIFASFVSILEICTHMVW